MTAMIFRYEKLHTDLFHSLWIPISAVRLCSTATTQFCNEQRDLYQTLGVESSATTKEIKAAYYQLSKVYHPDRHDGEEQKNLAAEKFLQVQIILFNRFQILLDYYEQIYLSDFSR